MISSINFLFDLIWLIIFLYFFYSQILHTYHRFLSSLEPCPQDSSSPMISNLSIPNMTFQEKAPQHLLPLPPDLKCQAAKFRECVFRYFGLTCTRCLPFESQMLSKDSFYIPYVPPRRLAMFALNAYKLLFPSGYNLEIISNSALYSRVGRPFRLPIRIFFCFLCFRIYRNSQNL